MVSNIAFNHCQCVESNINLLGILTMHGNLIFMHENKISTHENEMFMHEKENVCTKVFTGENSMHEVVYSPTTHEHNNNNNNKNDNNNNVDNDNNFK